MVIITDKELAELQDNSKNQLIARNRLLEQRYAKLLEENSNLEIKYLMSQQKLVNALITIDFLKKKKCF